MRRLLTVGLSCAPALAFGSIAAGQTSFIEASLQAGIDAPFEPSFAPGFIMTAGGAVGDFDRDGDQDIFIVSGGTRPDKLYINDGSGNFVDRAAEWGVDRLHLGAGAAVADVNGDGHLDLYVVSHGPTHTMETGHHCLYINSGSGTFTEEAAARGVDFTSTLNADGWGASFGDYDLDGDLDLAVAGWFRGNGGNRLFNNDGNGNFTDVTHNIAFDFFETRGFSPRFQDMNGDRYPELLWVADFGTSRYFINNTDGTFSESTTPSGVGLDSNGMGATVADFNADGMPDWYVTSIEQVPSGETSGNMLYINQGNHVFAESSTTLGVNMGGWAWGADGQDFDNDGDADLVWTNGWTWGNNQFPDDPTYIAYNQGDGSFSTPADFSGINHNENGRGLLTFDAEGDGDRDIVIFSIDVPARFYQNNLAQDGTANWLRIALDTRRAPGLAPDGIGARVEVTAGGQTGYHWVNASTNYLAQSEMAIHAGLGSAANASVRVAWPDGSFTDLQSVAANQSITVSTGCLADVNLDGMLTGADFNAWLTNYNDGCP